MDMPNELLASDQDPTSANGGLPRRWWQRRLWISLCLVGILAPLTFTFDPNGYLSTDTGGKTASVAAMSSRGDWNPDLGYWFEAADPEGRFFPFMSTTHTEDGQWLNTTSLTMVIPARALWIAGDATAVGGSRAVLLLPISGAVLAALAGGALERRMRVLAGRPSGAGHRSMWGIGLAGPVVVYALDFWEHSLGLAAMLWGIVATIDALAASGGRRRAASAFGAGLAFGVAATMRQEAMVYGMVAGATLVAGLAWEARWRAAAVRGASMLGGFALPVAVHLLAEIALTGGPIRAGRAAGTASGAGSSLGERLHTALITLTFPFNGEHPLSYLLGLGLVGALAWWTSTKLSGADDRWPTSVLRGVVVCIAAVWIIFSVRFVPGLVPTTPLALVGVVAAVRQRQWSPLAFGLIPIPLVLAVQFTEGAYAQWGGRYLMTSGAVLSVGAIALLGDHHRRLLLAVGTAGLLATLYGVVWRVQRSNIVMNDWTTLDAAAPEGTVVVWLDGHHAREGGPKMLDGRWVTAHDVADIPLLSAELAEQDIDAFMFVQPKSMDRPEFVGFEAGSAVGEMLLFDSELVPFERVGVGSGPRS